MSELIAITPLSQISPSRQLPPACRAAQDPGVPSLTIAPLPPGLPLPPEADIKAVFIFTDGTRRFITAADLQVDTQLTPDVAMQLRYSKLRELISAGGVAPCYYEIGDPALAALDLLTQIITEPLDQSYIEKLDRSIMRIKDDTVRAYLKFNVALILQQNGRLDASALKSRLDDLTAEKVADFRFYDMYAKFFLAEGRPKRAVEVMAKYIARQTGGGLQGLALEQQVEKLLTRQVEGHLLNQLGDYLMIWASKESYHRTRQKLIGLAEKCYLKSLGQDRQTAQQVATRLKLGEVNKLLAGIAELQEDEKASTERLNQAVKYLEEAAWLMPENPAIWTKLGDAYMFRAQLLGADKDLKNCQAAYERARTSDPGSVELALKTVAVLSQLGKSDEALKLMDEIVALAPENYILLSARADLLAQLGRFDEALAGYDKAFTLALKAPESGIACSEVYRRFTEMQRRMRLQLAQLSARYSPNPLRLILRLTGDLLYFSNPFNVVALTAKGRPKYNKQQLADFVAACGRLDQSLLGLYANRGRDVNFYLANVNFFDHLQREVESALEGSKQQMMEKEVIEALKAMIADYRGRVDSSVQKVVAQVKAEAAWKAATAETENAEQEKKNAEAIVQLVKQSFLQYLSLIDFIAAADLPEALTARLNELQKTVWEQLKARFEAVLNYAKKQSDLELALALFQLIAQLGGRTDATGKLPGGEKVKIEAQLAEVAGQFDAAVLAMIEIAKNNKDYQSLLSLAKDIKNMGPFALTSLAAALEAAQEAEDQTALEQVADFTLHVLDNERELSRNVREAYRRLAVSASNELDELASEPGGERVRTKAAIELWRLGEHDRSIEIFTELAEAVKTKEAQVFYLLDLAYMHLAREDKDEAIKYFKAVLRLAPGQEDIIREIGYLTDPNILPGDIILENSPYFSHHALRAVTVLYEHWFPDQAGQEITGLSDLYGKAGHLVRVRTEKTKSGIVAFYFDEPQVTEIRLKRLPGSNHLPLETKDEVILQELASCGLAEGDDCGLKVGDTYDARQVDAALQAAKMRLKSFEVADVKPAYDQKSGRVVLEVEISEKKNISGSVGGGGGNVNAMIYAESWVQNLFGGGEIIGWKADYNWLYFPGYKKYSLFEGQIYYKEPNLFRIGERTPVSFSPMVERYGGYDYETGGTQITNGGGVTFGVQLARNVGVHVTPSLYYLEHDSQSDFFRQGIRVSLDYDDRDDWLLPSQGQIFSVYVQPGAYFGGTPGTGYIKAGIAAEKYFALPADFVLMFGAKGDVGYNLMGGDFFFLGGNGYVRGAKDLSKNGPMITAGTAEIRSPVWNWGEYGQYGKCQPYLFADVGSVFSYSGRPGFGWGVGGGVRLVIPFLGLLNFYYGFPNGFGFQIGSVAPNF